jgi:glycerol-3-phosphate O-acyltransferase / dihydroxyacetone phosphate acyltransferase
MIFHLLKYWACGFIAAFYKHIQVRNLRHIKTNAPVIIAMNHPNAFTDPVLLTYLAYPQRLNYLARGDAFRPGFLAWFLGSIGIVPIFRLRDGGKEGLAKNEDSYRRVNEMLAGNAKVMVFAEGLCIQERRLRPLKKGVARMVFGAYEALNNPELQVVPVGINYSKPDKFRSNAFVNIGEPIFVSDFMDEYRANPARAYNTFLQVLEPKMRELVTHINDPVNDEVVYMLEMLCKRGRMKRDGTRGDMEADHDIQKELTAKVNTAAIARPGIVNEFRTGARAYFDRIRGEGLRDWLIDPAQSGSVNGFTLLLRSLVVLAGLPVYAVSLAAHFPAMALSDYFARRISSNKEFYSSFIIGVSMFTFLFVYLVVFFVILGIAPHVWWAVSGCILLLLSGIFSLWYHPFAMKTLGMLRILKNPALRDQLRMQRVRLMELVNKF